MNSKSISFSQHATVIYSPSSNAKKEAIIRASVNVHDDLHEAETGGSYYDTLSQWTPSTGEREALEIMCEYYQMCAVFKRLPTSVIFKVQAAIIFYDFIRLALYEACDTCWASQSIPIAEKCFLNCSNKFFLCYDCIRVKIMFASKTHVEVSHNKMRAVFHSPASTKSDE